MVQVRRLAIPDVIEIIPPRHGDHRGFFSEVWNAAALAGQGIPVTFVQDNHSYSADAGVVRGLHYQAPPAAQAKLVRVARGSIFDVAVDIRDGSPTFGQWVGLILSAQAWNQLLVPEGFAHGFMTLEPDCEVLYKVSAPYSREHDRSIRFDDPDIGVEWPLGGMTPILSEKDRGAPLLAQAAPAFRYEPQG
ncbi:MAG: dTDP-4-dehydrorhamnose 3,5-epimerase [Sphingomonadales bacterium]|jgi:dTDP-4-dehydrorhamnose 3,5-epimerase|nr:dTDP-4-dehydrorhamnose 3,5-epimerase [Sphingomonadales bacterium]